MEETITKTSISGLILIKRPTFDDDRGFFREPARIEAVNEVLGIEFKIAQMNHARSSKNTLRGIHVAPWNKLIYVTRGTAQVVVVDPRKDSETFGKHESFLIGDDNRSSVFVSQGLGNSYLVISNDADYVYLTDEEWSPGREFGIAWNDQELNISWQLNGGVPNLSEKDKNNPNLSSI